MNNYIMVNGQKIELTSEQVYLILGAVQQNPTGPATIELSEVPVGNTFKVGEHEFVVLDQKGDVTYAILKDLRPDSVFGNTNNYNGSTVELLCNGFANEIAAIIGEENIVPHTVDLTANDGLKCYGTIESRCSLLTADLYRRFVEILDKFKPDHWWWLATPWSTQKHDSDDYILCVAPSGVINYFSRCSYDLGVRPFLIFKSTIFVSN